MRTVPCDESTRPARRPRPGAGRRGPQPPGAPCGPWPWPSPSRRPRSPPPPHPQLAGRRLPVRRRRPGPGAPTAPAAPAAGAPTPAGRGSSSFAVLLAGATAHFVSGDGYLSNRQLATDLRRRRLAGHRRPPHPAQVLTRLADPRLFPRHSPGGAGTAVPRLDTGADEDIELASMTSGAARGSPHARTGTGRPPTLLLSLLPG